MDNDVQAWRLWFESGDEARPRWEQSPWAPKKAREIAAPDNSPKIKLDPNLKFQIGDRVTGCEGRAAHGWHGEITSIKRFADGSPYYQVFWEERAKSEIAAIARKPTIGMLEWQINYQGSRSSH